MATIIMRIKVKVEVSFAKPIKSMEGGGRVGDITYIHRQDGQKQTSQKVHKGGSLPTHSVHPLTSRTITW